MRCETRWTGPQCHWFEVCLLRVQCGGTGGGTIRIPNAETPIQIKSLGRHFGSHQPPQPHPSQRPHPGPLSFPGAASKSPNPTFGRGEWQRRESGIGAAPGGEPTSEFGARQGAGHAHCEHRGHSRLPPFHGDFRRPAFRFRDRIAAIRGPDAVEGLTAASGGGAGFPGRVAKCHFVTDRMFASTIITALGKPTKHRRNADQTKPR